jgi:hypothetical protein
MSVGRMTPEMKARLAEIKARNRGKLLKDVTPQEILVACDWAEEMRPVEDTLWVPSYLKYASEAQVAAFAGRLPHLVHEVGIWHLPGQPDTRRVMLFHTRTLWLALEFLTGANAKKYSRCASVGLAETYQLEPEGSANLPPLEVLR